MEKAYDLKDLAGRLKGRGLDVAEEAAKIVVEELVSWAEDSAKLSATPYDDLAAGALYPKLKELVLEQVDKIDGKQG